MCNGPHSKLFNCKKLPLFIPGDNYQIVPKGVCRMCLYCRTNIKFPKCHRGNEKWICNSSKQNVLICAQCPVIHKEVQTFFKAHHNSNMNIKENFELFAQTQQPRRVATNKTMLGDKSKQNVTLNNCPIGQTSCLSEILSIKLKDGSIFKVQIHYDDGSMHSLVSEQVTPICLNKSYSKFPIQLSTVCGSSTSIH